MRSLVMASKTSVSHWATKAMNERVRPFTRWEYITRILPGNSFQECCNILGEGGWELAVVYRARFNDTLVATFKRPKVAPEISHTLHSPKEN